MHVIFSFWTSFVLIKNVDSAADIYDFSILRGGHLGFLRWKKSFNQYIAKPSKNNIFKGFVSAPINFKMRMKKTAASKAVWLVTVDRLAPPYRFPHAIWATRTVLGMDLVVPILKSYFRLWNSWKRHCREPEKDPKTKPY